MKEIKACPHCGPGNSQVEVIEDDNGYFKVCCGACGSSSGIVSKRQTKILDPRDYVISLWNKRIPNDYAWNDIETVINFEPVIALYVQDKELQIELKIFSKDQEIPEKYIGWIPCPKTI